MATVDKAFKVKNGVITPSAATTVEPLIIPHGSAPSSPTNGSVWTTSSGMYVRINGSTVGPLGATGGVTAPLALSQGSSTPTLTVTQTGAGDALVVEDVASDSTPFRVTADGKVSINGANLGADDYLTVTGSMAVGGGDLQVVRETGQPRLTVYAAAGSGYYPATMRFARESLAYGATPDNSKIGIFDFTGKTSTDSYIALAQISVDAGVNGTNGPPTTISFFVNNSGSLSEKLTISNTAITSTVPVVLPGDPTTGLQAATKDYVDANAGGGSVTEVEIDFGTKPEYTKSFTITDAGVTGTTKIVVTPSGNTATGRVGDDGEWDAIMVAAKAGTGNFTVTAVAVPGPVVGKRKIYYQKF